MGGRGAPRVSACWYAASWYGQLGLLSTRSAGTAYWYAENALVNASGCWRIELHVASA